jgi:hypothetical protein
MTPVAMIKHIAVPQQRIRVQIGGCEGRMQASGFFADYIGFMINDTIESFLQVTWSYCESDDNSNGYQSHNSDEDFFKHEEIQMMKRNGG